MTFSSSKFSKFQKFLDKCSLEMHSKCFAQISVTLSGSPTFSPSWINRSCKMWIFSCNLSYFLPYRSYRSIFINRRNIIPLASFFGILYCFPSYCPYFLKTSPIYSRFVSSVFTLCISLIPNYYLTFTIPPRNTLSLSASTWLFDGRIWRINYLSI